MTVKELKEKLKNVPDNMYVFINQIDDEFELSLCNKVEVKEAKFSDDSDEECFSFENVLILSDEM